MMMIKVYILIIILSNIFNENDSTKVNDLILLCKVIEGIDKSSNYTSFEKIPSKIWIKHETSCKSENQLFSAKALSKSQTKDMTLC